MPTEVVVQTVANAGTGMKSLVFSDTLLTEGQIECFEVGRQLQRRALIKRSFDGRGFLNSLTMSSLSWSRSSWCFALQLLVYLLCLPVNAVWQIVKQLWLWMLFPFRYMATYMPPRGFNAPGEKTLQGIHYQFTPYFELQGHDYIECINRWVKILYGLDKAKYHNFARYLHQERKRLKDQGVNDPSFLAVTYRNQLSAARQRLSKDLGNY